MFFLNFRNRTKYFFIEKLLETKEKRPYQVSQFHLFPNQHSETVSFWWIAIIISWLLYSLVSFYCPPDHFFLFLFPVSFEKFTNIYLCVFLLPPSELSLSIFTTRQFFIDDSTRFFHNLLFLFLAKKGECWESIKYQKILTTAENLKILKIFWNGKNFFIHSNFSPNT